MREGLGRRKPDQPSTVDDAGAWPYSVRAAPRALANMDVAGASTNGHDRSNRASGTPGPPKSPDLYR